MGRSGVFVIALFAATSAHAGIIDLGSMMGGANIYTAGDFKANSSDVEGSIIAGGNVTIQGYSVNLNDKKAYGNYAVVAAGDVRLDNGTISNGKVYSGGSTILNQTPQVGSSGPQPIDFAATSLQFRELAKDLSTLGATGTVESLWGGAKVSGSGNGGVDIFNVSADMFNNSSHWMLNGLSAGQTLIFNVSGERGTFNNNGISFQPLSGYNVLFNFFEATDVDVRGVIGSVLAPNATVSANWGVINGNVVANRWDSTVQVNSNHYFQPVDVPGIGVPPPPPPVVVPPPPVVVPPPPVEVPNPPVEVPEPGTLALLIAGAFAVLALRRRRV